MADTITDITTQINTDIRDKTDNKSVTRDDVSDSLQTLANNQRPDWSETDPEALTYIQNKPSNKILIEGTVNIGDILGTSPLTVTGGFTSANKTDQGSGAILVTIDFPTIGTQNYIMVYNYLNNIVASNMDVYPPIIRTKTSTTLSFTIEEGSNITQDIKMLIQLKEFNGF